MEETSLPPYWFRLEGQDTQMFPLYKITTQNPMLALTIRDNKGKLLITRFFAPISQKELPMTGFLNASYIKIMEKAAEHLNKKNNDGAPYSVVKIDVRVVS